MCLEVGSHMAVEKSILAVVSWVLGTILSLCLGWSKPLVGGYGLLWEEGERKGVARELLSDIRLSQATLDLRSFTGGR